MEEADKLLWSVQVDHQLFALEKLDVTVGGRKTWREARSCLPHRSEEVSGRPSHYTGTRAAFTRA